MEDDELWRQRDAHDDQQQYSGLLTQTWLSPCIHAVDSDLPSAALADIGDFCSWLTDLKVAFIVFN